MTKFIGRTEELSLMHSLLGGKRARMIVIKGRRRIGKSRLVEEFVRINRLKLYNFMGLPPGENITAEHQRTEFARQLNKFFR